MDKIRKGKRMMGNEENKTLYDIYRGILCNNQSFQLSRRLPIFTSRFQLTILGTSELNCCVRNGNRWNLTVIVTDHMTDQV